MGSGSRLGARGAVCELRTGEMILGDEKEVRGEMGMADSRRADGSAWSGRLLVRSSRKATDGGERRSILARPAVCRPGCD